MPPTIGPQRVPEPPSTTITSSDSVKSEVVVWGVEPPVSSRWTSPPSAASAPARTKAVSLKPYGLSPSTSTRRSFSLMPSQTRPVGERTAQWTTARVSTR